MRRPHSILSALLACSLAFPARAEERDSPERELAAEFSKAVVAASDEAKSQYIASFPNVFQLRDAAKAFTDTFNGSEAVAFLKQVALDAKEGRAEQLAALIGLALLSEKQETIPFLTFHIGDRSSRLGWHAALAISFLPTNVARRIAEGFVTDADLDYQTRIQFLFLLRGVGDEGTLETLAKLEPPVAEVRDRAAWVIRRRLSLEQAEQQDRWARLELVFFQIGHWGPGFRSWKPELAWGAKQIHGIEPNVPVEFLEARLSLERTGSPRDHNIHYEIPLAAALAAIQKNAELLPLLDAWAATTDLGYVSHACAAAAEQLRGREKD